MTKNEAFLIAHAISGLAESTGNGNIPISEMYPLNDIVKISPKILIELQNMDIPGHAIEVFKWVGVDVTEK